MASIPFLHGRRLKSGATAWHWKPSPRLRARGWTNRALGETAGRQPSRDIIDQALTLNAQVEESERAGVPAAALAPKRYTFGDVVDAYRASPEYREDIAAKTRTNYDSWLGQLTFIAQDGSLPVRSIDNAMVAEWKKALREGGASPFKLASMLRVLRLLLRWAKANGIVESDATEGVKIPTPPSRRMLLAWRDIEDIGDLPDADPFGVRVLRVAFWTFLRREDLHQLNRFQWRELHGADPRDRAAMVNAKGEIWGFRVIPEKTRKHGTTVDCPIPPFLQPEIEAAFEKSQWLFPHAMDAAKPISADVIRRRVKPLLVAGGFPDHQLRDMRRSGMSWMNDMGAERGDIFAISGHPLDGQQKTMADIYMPPRTKKAIRAIAAAVRTLEAMRVREAEQLAALNTDG